MAEWRVPGRVAVAVDASVAANKGAASVRRWPDVLAEVLAPLIWRR